MLEHRKVVQELRQLCHTWKGREFLLRGKPVEGACINKCALAVVEVSARETRYAVSGEICSRVR